MSNTEAPKQSLVYLRRVIPKSLQPALRGLKKRIIRLSLPHEEPFYSVFPYTQVHRIRQENLLRLGHEIEARNVPGAIVECGVLDGGAAALMAYATRGSGRPIHLFDSWEGLPITTVKDREASKLWSGECVGSPRRVDAVMKRLKIDPARLTFYKGWFDQTFPTATVSEIALLHIDADFYSSVKLCLETWVSHMVPGGFIQIDDYSVFAGCRKATDEFLNASPRFRLESTGQITKAFYIRT